MSSVQGARSSDPARETLIYASAPSQPLKKCTASDFSTFVPFAGIIFRILNTMDFSMASTRRWTDNCMGWVPPYSSIYISMLFYIQTIRAMDAAGAISYGTELHHILDSITRHTPLETLWVPGPLVQFFKNLACFLPTADGSLGCVTPCLPNNPLWRRRAHYALPDPFYTHLPHIYAMISRLRSVCTTALEPGMNDTLFSRHVDGPAHCATLFGRENTGDEDNIMSSPGMMFVQPGNHRLWTNAANSLSSNCVPVSLDRAADAVNDTWRRFLIVDSVNKWFPPIVSMMSKYCQFWHGSTNLADCPPNCSAAGGAITCRSADGYNLSAPPNWSPPAQDHNDKAHGSANQIGHYTLDQHRKAILNATCPIRDIPTVCLYAASTYGMNLLIDEVDQPLLQAGTFWIFSPTAHRLDNGHTMPGILASIVHDYHSDSPLT